MTTLNNRLQLALLNRKKGRNILEKGFTLVELMIVIVIVGILSAVALPNFLNQTQKAKGTEATTKIGALLKEAHAEYQYDGVVTSVTAAMGPQAIAATSDGIFTYTLTAPTGNVFNVQAAAKAANAGGDGAIAGQLMFGCIDLTKGIPDISTKLLAAGTASDVTC